MKRLFGSLAVALLITSMAAFGYAQNRQASGCCEGKCGCPETATCHKAGQCNDACDKKQCCGKVCAHGSSAAEGACGHMCAGHDGSGAMCPGMKH